jgi:hypothetical protein
MDTAFFAGRRRTFFLAFARRIVPEVSTLDAAGESAFFAIIEDVLAQRPASVRRQIALFFVVLRWLPLLFFFGRLDRLSPEKQDRALHWFESNGLELLRKGFWGVRTLVFMGYYGRPEVYPKLGYEPSRQGNAPLAN